MSRFSLSSSSVAAFGGLVFALAGAGCGAGGAVGASGGSSSQALENALAACEELSADADAAAADLDAACAADAACDRPATEAAIAALYADAQASCDAQIAASTDDGDDGDDGDDHKVTICHSTGSARHPYVTITIDRHALPAHERHHDGRDLIPAPAEGCPAAAEGDEGEEDERGNGNGGGRDGRDNDCDDDGSSDDGDDGSDDGSDGSDDGSDDGAAPDCTTVRGEADAALADAAATRDAVCAADSEGACPTAQEAFDAAVLAIESGYAAVCGGPVVLE